MSAETLRAMYVAIDDGRLDAFRALLHPEVVYHRPGYAPLEGIEAVMHFYQHVRIIGSGVHALDRIVSEGSQHATFGRFTGVSRDGRPLDETFAEGFETRDGLIVRRQSYFFRPVI